MPASRLVVLSLALGLLAGCGQAKPKKVHVSGTVAMDGKPLPQGEIAFEIEGAGKPPELLPIVDGKFEGVLTVGKKRVMVSAVKNMGQQAGMGMGMDLVLNAVHEDYNANSKLTAEVTDGGLSPSSFEVKENKAKP